MTFRIQQTWWHIEEQYHPSSARKIRQVMDIFTNQAIISLKLRNSYFVGLRIYARNLNREIAFLENEDNSLILNLDPLDAYPLAPKEFVVSNPCEKPFRHVKIEFEYVFTRPYIKKVSLLKKRSEVKIDGQIQPEVYIYLPKGRRLDGNSIMREIIPLGKNKEGYNVIMECSKNNGDKFLIKFNKPFINELKGMRLYNYTIKEEDNDKLNTFLKDVPNEEISYSLGFTSKIDFKILFFSLIPFLFLIFSIIIILSKLNISSQFLINNNSTLLLPNNSMSFLIVVSGFSYFYISYIREGYDIPFRHVYFLIFIISIIAFCFWGFYSPADASQIVDNIGNSTMTTQIADNLSKINE